MAEGSDGSSGSAGSAGSGPDGAGVSGKDPSVGGPASPGISSPPPDVASPPIAVPSLPATSGPTTDTVRSVDNALGTNLSEPTRRVTRTVDGVSTGALDRVGRPGLGDQVGGAVSGITGGVLGR
jgi:hypothetical protein